MDVPKVLNDVPNFLKIRSGENFLKQNSKISYFFSYGYISPSLTVVLKKIVKPQSQRKL